MTQVYLDNASTSFPKPNVVYEAVERFLRENGASPARGSYPKAQESERILLKLRLKLSQLLGIDSPTNLIFTHNATDSLNLALKGYLREGDHVVVSDLEHNALLRPLWRLKQSRNVQVSIVRSDGFGLVSPDAMMEALKPHTRLVACVHASNVVGTVQPVREIAERLRAREIAFLVDGSQTVGAYPVNLAELQPDFFAFTGHKSLLGLTGTGGLYIRSGLDLDSFREGGSGSQSESLEQPSSWPEKYESGTPNMVGLVGLLAGVEYLLEQGISNVRAHEVQMNRLLMERLSEIPGVQIHGPEPEQKVAITSVSLAGLEASEVGQLLGKKFGVAVRSGIHCSPLVHQSLKTEGQGTVRFSLGWSTTHQEIETAVAAVRQIAESVYQRVLNCGEPSACVTL